MTENDDNNNKKKLKDPLHFLCQDMHNILLKEQSSEAKKTLCKEN